MPSPDLIIRGQRVVTPDAVAPAAVHILDGIISEVGPYDEIPEGCRVLEAGRNQIVMPGLVDTHVHINEPGRTDWEGFETATRAAAAGGVTTLVEMPLNSIPPTTTLENFREKLVAAEGQCSVDVGFWGGVVPGNVLELAPLLDAGVLGFKCFLVHSGVDEFPNVTEADLKEAIPELARLGAVLIVHAEVPEPIEEALRDEEEGGADPRKYSTFLKSRPREAENRAVELMIRLSRETGARVHIVHHSSADALPALREARAEGVRLTIETCPHYLCFAAEEIEDGATEFKCCPPVRERENREELWSALDEGVIEMVVSDHSPCPPGMKSLDTGNFLVAWGGISSLQLRLPIMWTLARERGYTVNRLAEWLARAPARLVGLDKRKGTIARGFDADLVIWDPDASFLVEPSMIQHKHKLTPYSGRTLSGVVEETYLRGRKIYDRGQFSEEPAGVLLKRGLE
ncbi:MAG TPA: allantoinase AllB [Pyrinomonadaceae bacterium]|nr:allantoinase AllB [Pyrinomonadaceae bacterium]